MTSNKCTKTTRKQRFKNLMKDRTTVEQGLTFNQIFCEVYQIPIEKYTYRNPDLGRSELDAHGGNILVEGIEKYVLIISKTPSHNFTMYSKICHPREFFRFGDTSGTYRF